MSDSRRLPVAIDRVDFARRYTGQFLQGLSEEEWFWCPSEFATHIAWQVGHLAVAQYNLCLRRVRGRVAADESVISDRFFDYFKLGSHPDPVPANNPPLAEILRVFHAVHQLAIAELATRSDTDLDVPVEQPHPAFKTKLEAVEYCPFHEFVHAGQIALLRRMMGKSPIR
jgi:hypothetical protein